MDLNRIRRLERAGFNADQAKIISELHTPNFIGSERGNFVQAEMVKAFITSIEYRQRFGS